MNVGYVAFSGNFLSYTLAWKSFLKTLHDPTGYRRW